MYRQEAEQIAEQILNDKIQEVLDKNGYELADWIQ